MNRFIFDEDGGLLIVETKFGNLQIEQSKFSTSVKFVENSFMNPYPSHIEDRSYLKVKVISMVSDNAPDEKS